MIKNTLFALLLTLCSAGLFANNLKIAQAANNQIGKTLYYSPDYVQLSYPNGDVPLVKGVCTDVVIRAMRATGNDLQKLVHEDMQKNFSAYPKIWGLKSTDKNIDHRRVPNLETFFTRQGKSLPLSTKGSDYKAGDIVSWRLDNGLAHIGVVSDRLSSDKKRPLIVHNIGNGAKAEDVLFSWKMIGHYRYF